MAVVKERGSSERREGQCLAVFLLPMCQVGLQGVQGCVSLLPSGSDL
jgi:hypothetical protein